MTTPVPPTKQDVEGIFMRHLERRHTKFPDDFFTQNATLNGRPCVLPCFYCMRRFVGPRVVIPDRVTEHTMFVFKPPPHCDVYCSLGCALSAAKVEQVPLVHMMSRIMYGCSRPVRPSMDRKLLVYGLVTEKQYCTDVYREEHGFEPRLMPDQLREHAEVNPHVLANHVLNYAKGGLPVENMPHLKAFIEACNERDEEERKKERTRFKAEAERKAQGEMEVDEEAAKKAAEEEDDDDDPPEADMVEDDTAIDVVPDGFEDAFEDDDDDDD